jgi:hypothetical protein
MKPLVSLTDAALVFRVTTRTIYNWIEEDGIQAEDHLYSIDDLQNAHDKRHKPKPRLRYR